MPEATEVTEMTATGETGYQATPRGYSVYHSNDEPGRFAWIVEGTDGSLYRVPAEPGGWLRRSDYHGQIEKLKVVSQKKARSICWRVYGDVGRVTIQGANLEPR